MYAGQDVLFRDGDSCGDLIETGGNFGPHYLGSTCSFVDIFFAADQATVSLFAQAGRSRPEASGRTRR